MIVHCLISARWDSKLFCRIYPQDNCRNCATKLPLPIWNVKKQHMYRAHL